MMSENTKGEWITVRPDDERIVRGSRVRVGTIEARVYDAGSPWLGLRDPSLDVHRHDGPDVELWVPEVTLPLPTEPGPFWGRVERDRDTYAGWVWRSLVGLYVTPCDVSCHRHHHAEHVTRLPLPDSEREALR